MQETSKAFKRRSSDLPFWSTVFVGDGIDIGSGDDPFRKEWFPGVRSVEPFDLKDGDAQCVARYRRPCSYDFVHSSNCLEHMFNPFAALLGWLHLVRPGGHVVFTVPDEDLYEQGVFPSRWNLTHNFTFTLAKKDSWSPRSKNLADFLSRIPFCEVRRVHLADTGYDRSLKGVDQTMGEAEAFWEVVLRKMPVEQRKRTFKHSGARGDLVYGLATMKAMGGGTLLVSRKEDGSFHIPVSDSELEGMRKFLGSLGYVDSVKEWDGGECDVDMDEFRELNTEYNLLSDLQAMRFGVYHDQERPWIDPGAVVPIREADIVVGRSERYHGLLDWEELRPWKDRCVFVGSEKEHGDFVGKTGLDIRRVHTEGWAELAGVIRGGKLFVGNQSFAYSFAEAMKVPRVLECFPIAPNCDPRGPDGYVVLTQKVIRRYVDGSGEDCGGERTRTRNPCKELPLKSIGRRKVLPSFCMVVAATGGMESMMPLLEEARKAKCAMVVQERGATFEEMCNLGAERASGKILCFVDARCGLTYKEVEVVVGQMLDEKTGVTGACVSARARPHVSGPCFAVSRQAYESLGLFNPAMGPGAMNMLELNLRYMRGRFGCKSVYLPRWMGWRGDDCPSDEANSRYIEKVYGVKL